MTFRDIIDRIEAAAKAQPAIGTVVPNDIFALNAMSSVKYGVFGWVQETAHRASFATGIITYSLTLIYADRLLEDRSNMTDIQSTGIDVIGGVVATLRDRDVYVSDSYDITAFVQRFSDDCAGVMARISVEVPMGTLCAPNFNC